MASPNPQRDFAEQVVRQLRDAGHEALWAGGCVRDELLGMEPKDFDVATSARPEQVRELFGQRRTLAIGAAFGVITILGGKELEPIEVATFRSDGAYIDGRHPSEVVFTTAEEDAQRRDFTINGLFYDPVDERLIDYVGGEQDLKLQIVRAIGDPSARFAEDKLRMLRAIRFATTFGFSLDEATLAAIRAMAPEVQVVSAERIGMELRKILLHPKRSRGMSLLRESGLLEYVISYSFEEPPDALAENEDYESREVQFQHILETLDRLRSPSLPLALAALLMEQESAMASSVVPRELRFTKKEGERVNWLLASIGLIESAHNFYWPIIQRLLIHPGAGELIALHEARVGGEDAGSAFCKAKLQLPQDVLNPPPLLTGDDMVAHGHKPGRYFSVLLDHVRDAQLEGKISDQSQALELAGKWLQEHPPE